MDVKFTFSIGERVVTPFGEIGIVVIAAVDRECNSYYVKTKGAEQWFWEDILKPEPKAV